MQLIPGNNRLVLKLKVELSQQFAQTKLPPKAHHCSDEGKIQTLFPFGKIHIGLLFHQ